MVIYKWVEWILGANEKMDVVLPENSCCSPKMIKWLPPKVGWVRLNADGALCSNSKLAACGGSYQG